MSETKDCNCHVIYFYLSLFLLTAVFVILKVTEQIAWSWWWVTAPLWVFPALVFTIILAMIGFLLSVGIPYAIYKLIKMERETKTMSETLVYGFSKEFGDVLCKGESCDKERPVQENKSSS